MKYDFLVIGLPRSGTHMVATALNSHPDIQCREEDAAPLYGHCTGRVFTRLDDLPFANKHIVITRPWQDRLKSWRTTGTSHSERPWSIYGKPGRKDPLPDDDDRLLLFSRMVNAHVVAYDHLTAGCNTRVFPAEVCRQLCAYLEVDFHLFRPRTHKPDGGSPKT